MRVKVRIHGDNVIECERAWKLVKTAFFHSRNVEWRVFGSPISPCYDLGGNKSEGACAQFFPGFHRWHPDILDHIRERGAPLRETADAIVCILSTEASNDKIETPVVAIEFCGALPAGNQAWQRCGRGYSLSMAGIPYVYIAEIGGFELDAQRRERAMRFPNPIVPFAYVAHTSGSPAPCLPIFLPSPVITDAAAADLSEFTGENELITFVRDVICRRDYSDTVGSLISKTMGFVNFLSRNRKRGDTFVAPNWEQWMEHIGTGQKGADFVCDQRLPWTKKAYIERLTHTAEQVIAETPKFAVGLGAGDVPVCLVSRSKRPSFAKMIIGQYPDLTKGFQEWLAKDGHLGICWVMGFKPRGDDARPDRGLPPLSRMLLGPHIDLMTFVYGPAKRYMWDLLSTNPIQLAEQNGLWESILGISDAILIDSSTDPGITKKGYDRSHWGSSKPTPRVGRMSAVKPWPTAIGENDVDTIIHLLLSSEDERHIFEGMCNPPGGDWSGISVVDCEDPALELRWLSLPRISPTGCKRPDHVFQFFEKGMKPIILAIESKESAQRLESGIGDRLTGYVRHLMASPVSAQRSRDSSAWRRSTRSLELSDYRFASAVAFLCGGEQDMNSVKVTTNADLIFGVQLSKRNRSANISIFACSLIGNELSSIIRTRTATGDLRLSAEYGSVI